jgi:hypothetical protein
MTTEKLTLRTYERPLLVKRDRLTLVSGDDAILISIIAPGN